MKLVNKHSLSEYAKIVALRVAAHKGPFRVVEGRGCW